MLCRVRKEHQDGKKHGVTEEGERLLQWAVSFDHLFSSEPAAEQERSGWTKTPLFLPCRPTLSHIAGSVSNEHLNSEPLQVNTVLSKQ